MNATAPVPSGALCARHPDRAAVDVCERCGAFVCLEDRVLLDAKRFCATCAARPDVDYLEAFRLRYWGKRDGWAWLLGVGGLLNAFSTLALLMGGDFIAAPAMAFLAVTGVCFWFGLRWARPGLILAQIFSMLTTAFTGGATATAHLFALLISIAIYNDTRNKLFFKVDVPRTTLKKMWDTYANNVVARWGFMLAILGVFVPGLGAVALVLSIVGLRRVDPDAHPPVGRKKQATAGIVLGSLAVLFWGAVGASLLIER